MEVGGEDGNQWEAIFASEREMEEGVWQKG